MPLNTDITEAQIAGGDLVFAQVNPPSHGTFGNNFELFMFEVVDANGTSSSATMTIDVTSKTDEWLNTSGANGAIWTDTTNAGTNWSLGAVPSSSDNVLIDNSGSGPYTVTIPSGQTANAASVTLDSASATLSIQGALDDNDALIFDAGTLALSGSTLTSGSTTLTINNYGSIIASSNNSSIVNADITNENSGASIEANGTTLSLDNDTISGGTITEVAANFNSLIQVESGYALTLENTTLSGRALTVEDSSTLMLEGSTLTGGAGTLNITNDGTIVVSTANSVIENVAFSAQTGSGLEIEGVTLSLDGVIYSGGATVTEAGSGSMLQVDACDSTTFGSGTTTFTNGALTAPAVRRCRLRARC